MGVLQEALQPQADDWPGGVAVTMVHFFQIAVEGIDQETVEMTVPGNEMFQLCVAGGSKNVDCGLHPPVALLLEEQEQLPVEGIIVSVFPATV